MMEKEIFNTEKASNDENGELMNHGKEINENLTLIEAEKQRLLDVYKNTPDPIFSNYRVYSAVGIPRIDYQYFSPSKEIDLFRKEVENLCERALTGRYDYIIMFDKSARGYGLLANKILPIIRLKYAFLNKLDPDGIDLPKIVFTNPANRDMRYSRKVDYPRKPTDVNSEVYGKLERTFKQIFQEKVLIFDESSRNPGGRDSLVRRTKESYESQMNPKYDIGVAWGDSTTSGGHDLVSRNEFPYKRSGYGIDDLHIAAVIYETDVNGEDMPKAKMLPMDSSFVAGYQPSNDEINDYRMGKIIGAGFSDTNQLRKQIRIEHSMIAKKTLEDVVEVMK